MKQRHNHLILAALVLLSVPAAAGFGYVEGETGATVLPGDTAIFTVYVFGDTGDVKVTHTGEPAGWDVNVEPGRVNVPVNDDYRYVRTASGYQQAIPVTLTADIPLHTDPGTYRTTLLLETAAEDGTVDGSGVALRQRQHIDFTVNVLEPAAVGGETRDEDTDRETEAGTDRSDPGGAAITGTAEEGKDDTRTGKATGVTGRVTADRVTDPVVLFILFQIMWGIALVYLLKRRQYL